MHRSSRIGDLTFAILAADDDEVLDLIADAAVADAAPDLLALILPLNDSTWVCEIARGRFSGALLGSQVSGAPGASAVDSHLAFALMQDDPAQLATLTWMDLSRGLTGDFLVPGTTARDDDVLGGDLFSLDAGAVPADVPGSGTEHEIALRMVEAGASRRGVLVAVRFHPSAPDSAGPFTPAEHVSLDAYASLLSFAVAGAGQHSAIEDDLRDERDRIARDLHDLAIQELFAVGMQLESMRSKAKEFSEYSADGPVARSLDLSVSGIERSIAEIRGIVQSLRNETQEVTLSQRLRHECGMAIAGLGFAPSLQFHSPVEEIDAITGEMHDDVVAVVKECLANAARHAHASAVAVSVAMFREGVDHVIQVNVSDNGRGIDPSVTRRSGLANLRSRARRHMGWVDFYALEPGTMVSWRGTLFANEELEREARREAATGHADAAA